MALGSLLLRLGLMQRAQHQPASLPPGRNSGGGGNNNNRWPCLVRTQLAFRGARAATRPGRAAWRVPGAGRRPQGHLLSARLGRRDRFLATESPAPRQTQQVAAADEDEEDEGEQF